MSEEENQNEVKNNLNDEPDKQEVNEENNEFNDEEENINNVDNEQENKEENKDENVQQNEEDNQNNSKEENVNDENTEQQNIEENDKQDENEEQKEDNNDEQNEDNNEEQNEENGNNEEQNDEHNEEEQNDEHNNEEEHNDNEEEDNENEEHNEEQNEEYNEEENEQQQESNQPTIESLKSEIEELKLQLTSKENEISTLKEENTLLLNTLTETKESLENELSEVYGRKEVETIFHLISQENENRLQSKIISIKSMIEQLRQKFDLELNEKERQLKEQLSLFETETQKWNSKETDYKTTITVLDHKLIEKDQTINHYIKEKNELENIIIKQEEKLSNLVNKVSKIEVLLNRKNKVLKENEIWAMDLINLVEQQKNQIKQLKIKSKENDPNAYLSINNPMFKGKRDDNNDHKIKMSYDFHHGKVNQLIDNSNNNNNNSNYFNSQTSQLILPNISQGNAYNNIHTVLDKATKDENEEKITEFKYMMNQLLSEVGQ